MRCLSSQQMLPTISPSIHPSLNICSTVSFCKRTSPRKARAHTRRLRLSYTDTKPRGRAVGTSARKTCMRDVSGEATLPTWRLLRRNARAGARVWWGNYPCMVGELLMGTAQAHMLAASSWATYLRISPDFTVFAHLPGLTRTSDRRGATPPALRAPVAAVSRARARLSVGAHSGARVRTSSFALTRAQAYAPSLTNLLRMDIAFLKGSGSLQSSPGVENHHFCFTATRVSR